MFFLSFLPSFFRVGDTLTSKSNTDRTAGIGGRDSRGTIIVFEKMEYCQAGVCLHLGEKSVKGFRCLTYVLVPLVFLPVTVCIGASSIPASHSMYWCL